MSMTPQQSVALARLLGHDREDWDAAGIHAAVVKLAHDPQPWPVLQVQAVTNAGDMANRTPECILWPLPAVAPVRRLPGVRPEPTEPCAAHGGTIVRQDGVYHCCWIADRPVPVRSPRRSRPAPPGIREQVAGSLRVKETDTK